MADTAIKDPAQYTKLPAGTRVSFGKPGELIGAAKLLQSAVSIGATGKKGASFEVTRLIDTERKYQSDMSEGEDKTYVFHDDVDDANQLSLLDAADVNQTVVIFIEFPNRRIAESTIVLSGWSLQEVSSPSGKVLQVEVYGKQNSIKWSVKAASAGKGE